MIELCDIHDRQKAVFLRSTRPTEKAKMDTLPTVGEATLALANSPKVAIATSGGGIGMGMLARENLEFINSILGTLSMFIGVLTGTVIFAVWVIKLIRYCKANTLEPKDPT
jgi:hypothetical protein